MGRKNGLGVSVMMGVLMLGLVLQQVQVEGKSCCKTTAGRNCYNVCRLAGTPRPVCAGLCGCKIISGSKCPPDYPKLNLLPSFAGEPDAVRYCNLGCTSSVCDNMRNTAVPEAVDGSGEMLQEKEGTVKSCDDACDRYCKGYAGIMSAAAIE